MAPAVTGAPFTRSTRLPVNWADEAEGLRKRLVKEYPESPHAQ